MLNIQNRCWAFYIKREAGGNMKKSRVICLLTAIVIGAGLTGCGTDSHYTVDTQGKTHEENTFYVTDEEDKQLGFAESTKDKDSGITYMGTQEVNGKQYKVYHAVETEKNKDNNAIKIGRPKFFDKTEFVMSYTNSGKSDNDTEWLNVYVSMNNPVLFTNGELSTDKKSVEFKDVQDKKGKGLLYVYTKSAKNGVMLSSKNMIAVTSEKMKQGGTMNVTEKNAIVTSKVSYGLTKDGTISIETPDKIQKVTVNGKAVSFKGNKIKISKSGKYTVKVKTKYFNNKFKLVVDKDKPVIATKRSGKDMSVSVMDNDKDMSVFVDNRAPYVDGRASLAYAEKLKGGKYRMKLKVIGNGSHTVKAVDSAGNVSKVTFTIR